MPIAITKEEFYKIINRAIRQCANSEDKSVNTEIKIFCEKYEYYHSNNTQLNLFEEIPTKYEIARGQYFCDILDEYRCSVDEYLPNNTELCEKKYRYLYDYIVENAEYITEDNSKILEMTIKRHLPEYKNIVVMENYNKRAGEILAENKKKHRNKEELKGLGKIALNFFNEVLNNKELSKIGACPEKLKLYCSSLNIVNYLPKEQYSRTKKYELKKKLYSVIKKTATALGTQYNEIVQKAGIEEERYAKAINKARYYGRKKREETFQIRNLISQEEWMCK